MLQIEERLTQKMNQHSEELLDKIRDSSVEMAFVNDRQAAAWIPRQLRLNDDDAVVAPIRQLDAVPILVARLVDLDCRYSREAKPAALVLLLEILDKVYVHLCDSLDVIKVCLSVNSIS